MTYHISPAHPQSQLHHPLLSGSPTHPYHPSLPGPTKNNVISRSAINNKSNLVTVDVNLRTVGVNGNMVGVNEKCTLDFGIWYDVIIASMVGVPEWKGWGVRGGVGWSGRVKPEQRC